MTNAIDGVITVTGIRNNGYKSACLNVEDNLRAGIELSVAASCGKLTCGCIDEKAIPLQGSALNVLGVGIGSAGGAFSTIEVVVGSIINLNLTGGGIPRIKIGYLTIDSAKDGCEVKVKSSFLSGKHLHTCNSLGKSTCTSVTKLYELNGCIGGMDTIHRDVTKVLVVRGIITLNGNVSAKLGVDNCNCSICTPCTADSGATKSYALISSELTAIEDSTVNDSIVSALVRALECCDVACSTLIVLYGIDNVDSTVLEECGIVSTEDEVGVTGNKYILKILTACEELESILNTEKSAVLHYESVSLNKECKTSLNSKACCIHSILAVPVVGNGNVLDSYVVCRLSYSNSLSRVGSMSKSACVNKAVERIPLDNYLIGSIAPTDNVEIRNFDLKLFLVKTGSDVKLLNCVLINLCCIIKRALNSLECMVRTAESTCKTFVCRVNKKLVYTILIRSRLAICNVNLYLCRNVIRRDSKYVVISVGRIKSGDFIIGNGELMSSLAALTDYENGKTVGGKLVTNEVNFLPAVVVIETIAITGVVRKLFNCVKAKLDCFGSIYVNTVLDRLVILISNGDSIYTGDAHINLRCINSYICKVKTIGLAVREGCVKLKTGKVKLVAYKVVDLTCSNKLKAVLRSDLNQARKFKIVYVNSTAYTLD